MRSFIFASVLVCCLSLYSVSAENAQQSNNTEKIPEGLEKSDWQSIREAYEAGRHKFHPVEGGWQASNPGQQWTTKFNGRSFIAEPKDGGWQWGLEFKSFGFGINQTQMEGDPRVSANGQRLAYQWTDTVQEWFINDDRGLEHGFTISQRPAAVQDQAAGYIPLSFTLATRGSLRPTISPDALTVYFRDHNYAPVLNYSGLKVWDADGRILTSKFVAAGNNQVKLLIQESGARYPLTIDPIAQQAYLKSGNNGGDTDDNFGSAVAVAGETVVVAASAEDGGTTGVNTTPFDSASNSGAVYIFTRNGTTWSQQAYLKASNTGAGDNFGVSVAISGDTLVVGANLEDSGLLGAIGVPNENAINSGAAYVFTRSGSTWSQQAYLKANVASANDQFGYSVSVSDDTVAVGAHLEDSDTPGVNGIANENATDAGACFVFTRNGADWEQQGYLKASIPSESDFFGKAVSVSQNTVVIGVPQAGLAQNGAAYVFIRDGSTWSEQAHLVASYRMPDYYFGNSVGISDDTLIVGSFRDDSSRGGINVIPTNGAEQSGSAYIFVRSGTTWNLQAYLKADNPGIGDHFGISVAISGDTVVMGAQSENSSTTGINSINDNGSSDSGAAYVFTRAGSVWSQQAFIKPSNTGAGDLFGGSVAVSGELVVVGAIKEDSNTSGINSLPNDNVSDSGAAYIFSRSGNFWSEQAYLKSSNTPTGNGVDDEFGCSVAISGDTVVVGALGDNSDSTGVNSVLNAGAVYVFVRIDNVWRQEAYLKPNIVLSGSYFGTSVSISGDTIAIGADGDSSNTAGVNSIPSGYLSSSGAAYIFIRNGTSWSQEAYLKASNPGFDDFFGESVSVSGDIVVVGSPNEDGNSIVVNGVSNNLASDSGAAYVFSRTGATWSQQAYLKANNSERADRFGTSVSASGSTVVIGAHREDSSTSGVNSIPDNGASSSGAAYVFSLVGGEWIQQAYLKSSNPGADDFFGNSVTMWRDTLCVGAHGEDSSTTGMNSIPNEDKGASGAAYIFVRSGSTWVQQAYLKSNNTFETTSLGYSLAMSDNTLVIGALRYGNPYSGAAFVFTRSGSIWTQQAILQASNPRFDDRFGSGVAVSGDFVVVGASYEDSGTAGINTIPDENASDSGAAYIFSGFGPPPLLSVESVSPSIGSVSGGTVLAVTGVGFTDASAVTIGGIPAISFVVNSETSITATTPSRTVGVVDVVVTTPFGSAIGSSLFRYSEPEIAVSQSATLSDGEGSVAFGTVNVGGPTKTLSFTISNPSAVPLKNLQIIKDGADFADFSASTLSGTIIPAGGNLVFTVTFNPSSGGGKTAAIHIASDVSGAQNPFDITLSGDGNTRPIFAGFAGSTPFQTAVTIPLGNLLAQTSDTEGGPLAVTFAGPFSRYGGTAVLQNGSILYTPPAGFSGADTFTVTIADQHSASISPVATVMVLSNGIAGPAVQVSRLPSGQVEVAFQGSPGALYQIERSTDMSSWAVVGNVSASENGVVNFTGLPPQPVSAFYRLRKL